MRSNNHKRGLAGVPDEFDPNFNIVTP